jgi:tetratricopeptide (TPR) repeat protein
VVARQRKLPHPANAHSLWSLAVIAKKKTTSGINIDNNKKGQMTKIKQIAIIGLLLTFIACNNNSKQSFIDHLTKANKYLVTCDFENGLKELELAKQIEPQNAEIYYSIGQTYFLLSDFKNAIDNYDKAIKLNPKYTFAYYSRGLTKSFNGDNLGG